MEKSPKRARINFLIYYEVDGDTSKHSLQSSTYFKVWPGPRVGALFAPARSVTQGYVWVS